MLGCVLPRLHQVRLLLTAVAPPLAVLAALPTAAGAETADDGEGLELLPKPSACGDTDAGVVTSTICSPDLLRRPRCCRLQHPGTQYGTGRRRRLLRCPNRSVWHPDSIETAAAAAVSVAASGRRLACGAQRYFLLIILPLQQMHLSQASAEDLAAVCSSNHVEDEPSRMSHTLPADVDLGAGY